jgi:hypothetical protein
MTEATEPTTAAETVTEGAEQKQEEQTTFTQVDVDRIVKDRLAKQAKSIAEKFSDYDETKAEAAKAKSLEERLGSLESELSSTKAESLRTGIAAKFGISTEKGAKGEPSDADLFLTGTDEDTLTAQAQRLAGRQAESKKQGNVAPKEGETKTTGGPSADLREFAKGLFGTPD